MLKAAVEGRLVVTEADLSRAESRNYEPASVLLERIIEERRRRWEETPATIVGRKRRYVEPMSPNSTLLPPLPRGPNILAQEIADDLRSALGQIEDILGDLERRVAPRELK